MQSRSHEMQNTSRSYNIVSRNYEILPDTCMYLVTTRCASRNYNNYEIANTYHVALTIFRNDRNKNKRGD